MTASYGKGATVVAVAVIWLVCAVALPTAHAETNPHPGQIVLTSSTETIAVPQALPTFKPEAGFEPSLKEIHQTATFQTDLYADSVDPGEDTYWHRLELKGQLEENTSRKFVVSLRNPIINHLTAFLVDDQGNLIDEKSLGILDEPSSATRIAISQNFAFSISDGQTLYLYIKKRSVSPSILLINFHSVAAYETAMLHRYLFWGGVIAFLLGLALYNAIIYALSASQVYLWYLAFYAVSFVYFGGIHGFGALLWPGALQLWLATHLMTLNFVLGWLIVHFAVSFLNASKTAPAHYRLLKIFDVIFISGFLLSFYFYEYQLIPLLSLVKLIASLYVISMGIRAYWNGFYPARFFLLSWTILLVGTSINLATYAGQLPVNFYTMHAFFIGSAFELLLLSVALADRLRFTEYQVVTQAYVDPRTGQPNLSYFQSRRFRVSRSAVLESHQPAVLLLQTEGIKNLLGLLGPQHMEGIYRTHIRRLESFVKDKPWIIAYPLSRKDHRYMVTLPGNQILLLVQHQGDISPIVEDLLALSEQAISVDEYESKLTFRIGATDLPMPSAGQSDLSFSAVYEAYRQAQLALIFSERESLLWMRFSPEQDDKMRKHEVILSDLRKAIENSQFSIFIQPQFSANDCELVGGEVLVRWIHDKKGMIPPFEFIPIAEQTGNIYPITKIVIEKAVSWLHELKENKSLPQDFCLSVNLSAHDIYREDLVDFIVDQTELCDIPARYLKFELTESAVMHDYVRFMAVIDDLRSKGFGIALDDFGTGYSSMSYIQKMQADEIKIDRSFVSSIHSNDINRKIVRAIVQISQSTNATTVAEGVEDQDELQAVRELGVDRVQGFLLGKPVPADEFEAQFIAASEREI